ncbi:MAG: hypothetical protein COB96_03360 [Planctomycetota bacterium]|nr:MAG: hypothetical protein COB96_03360 [Planctomycetota bacterium]
MINARVMFTLCAAGAFTVLSTSIPASFLLKAAGPKNGVAAQPGDFANCTECHSTNLVNSGPGSMKSDMPTVWTPGQTYNLNVKIGDPVAIRWGFELVALDKNGDSAGTLTPIDSSTQVSVQGTTNREFIKHTQSGTQLGTVGAASWDFSWTAPSAGTGTVRFYAAGNAANGNNKNSGDFIYTMAKAVAEDGSGLRASLTLQPDSSSVRLGDAITIRARIRDHSGSSHSFVFVSRLILPNGNTYPSGSWLVGPINVNIAANLDETIDIVHNIPVSTPLITVEYQGFIGIAPSTLLDRDSFMLTIVP